MEVLLGQTPIRRHVIAAAAALGALFSPTAQAASELTTPTASFSQEELIDSEMAIWREHQIYLRKLNDLHNAVAKELAVTKLMQACETLGRRCTGWGIAETPLRDPENAKKAAAKKPAGTKIVRQPLPIVAAIYQGQASLYHGERHYEARLGDRVGNYRVERVNTDSVVLSKANRNYVLPVSWRSEPRGKQ